MNEIAENRFHFIDSSGVLEERLFPEGDTVVERFKDPACFLFFQFSLEIVQQIFVFSRPFFGDRNEQICQRALEFEVFTAGKMLPAVQLSVVEGSGKELQQLHIIFRPDLIDGLHIVFLRREQDFNIFLPGLALDAVIDLAQILIQESGISSLQDRLIKGFGRFFILVGKDVFRSLLGIFGIAALETVDDTGVERSFRFGRFFAFLHPAREKVNNIVEAVEMMKDPDTDHKNQQQREDLGDDLQRNDHRRLSRFLFVNQLGCHRIGTAGRVPLRRTMRTGRAFGSGSSGTCRIRQIFIQRTNDFAVNGAFFGITGHHGKDQIADGFRDIFTVVHRCHGVVIDFDPE